MSDEQLTPAVVNANPLALMQQMGKRFVELMESGTPQAWRQLERDLMLNMHILSPATIPFKDLVATAAECEERAKGSGGKVGKSSEEVLRDFLTNPPPTFSVDMAQPSSVEPLPTPALSAPAQSEPSTPVVTISDGLKDS